MKKYFIETSVIISFLRGEKGTVDLLESLDGELTSSFVCLSELYEGIRRVKDGKKAERGVLDFFAGVSEIYGLDYPIAENFGRVRANLKKKGQVIEDLDIFLAATCLAYGLTLVTFNSKHFKRVDNLEILLVE